MTRKDAESFPDYCVICQSYDVLRYKDHTLGTRGFCQDCMRHVVSADCFLMQCGIKDPPTILIYSARHRLY
jgi:hypothetical protein